MNDIDKDSAVLAPCPFCGGEAFTHYHGLEATYSVECEDCLAKMPYVGITEAEAIAAWNTRQPTPEQSNG